MKYREGQLRAAGGRTRPGVILALVCAAQFMLILDLVVVNVALPTMQKDLRLSPSDLQWVVIIYGLTFGGFLLLGGRAADLLGRRSVLVAGLTMFTAGSLAAGLAGSLIPLLVARAVQGLGAAMAAPATGATCSPRSSHPESASACPGWPSRSRRSPGSKTRSPDSPGAWSPPRKKSAPPSGSRSSRPPHSLARQRSRRPPGANLPSAFSPRRQASSAARWWPPDSALPPRSPPGSCSGEPNGRRPRLASRNQRPNPRCVRHDTARRGSALGNRPAEIE
jgi:Major Facilitator Superfamily